MTIPRCEHLCRPVGASPATRRAPAGKNKDGRLPARLRGGTGGDRAALLALLCLASLGRCLADNPNAVTYDGTHRLVSFALSLSASGGGASTEHRSVLAAPWPVPGGITQVLAITKEAGSFVAYTGFKTTGSNTLTLAKVRINGPPSADLLWSTASDPSDSRWDSLEIEGSLDHVVASSSWWPDGYLQRFDTVTGAKKWSHKVWNAAIALASDTHCFTGESMRRVSWRPLSSGGRQWYHYTGSNRELLCPPTVSADGTRAIGAESMLFRGGTKKMFLLNTASGSAIRTVNMNSGGNYEHSCGVALFTPDGHCAIVTENNVITCLDLSGNLRWTLPTTLQPVFHPESLLFTDGGPRFSSTRGCCRDGMAFAAMEQSTTVVIEEVKSDTGVRGLMRFNWKDPAQRDYTWFNASITDVRTLITTKLNASASSGNDALLVELDVGGTLELRAYTGLQWDRAQPTLLWQSPPFTGYVIGHMDGEIIIRKADKTLEAFRPVSVPCLAGSYQNKSAAGGCSPCPAGTYGDVQGAASEAEGCSECPYGTFSAAGRSSCTDCAAGTFAVQASGMCPQGRFGTRRALLSQDQACAGSCPVGTWGNATGGDSAAEACPYQCPPGKWGTASGAASEAAACPHSCPAGTFGNVRGGRSFAEACPGRCAPGTWGAVTGATSAGAACPGQCPPGTYGTVSGATNESEACPLRCPQGRFGAVGGQSALEDACPGQCPRGTYGPSEGATSVADCSCCPVGTYGVMAGAASAADCEACPLGSDSSQCSSDRSACQSCPLGTWYALATGACVECPAGTYGLVSPILSPDDCVQCAPGKVSSLLSANSSSACEPCPPGAYGANATHCLPCAAGTVASTPGQPQCRPCAPGTAEAGRTACEPCAPGTYADGDGASVCTPCTLGTTSGGRGADSADSCRPCPLGEFANATGHDRCTPCPGGHYTLTTAATTSAECLACPPGTYLRGGQCVECPAGTHNPLAAASDPALCVTCPAGSFSANGAAACEQCPAGTASSVPAATSNASCAPCREGAYAAQSGQVECTACPLGSTSAVIGATSADTCEPCPPGTFELFSSCRTCPAGTYQPLPGQGSDAACLQSPPGHYAPPGSVQAVECPAGTYRTDGGAMSVEQCLPCRAGTYSHTPAATTADTCALCPGGTASPAVAANASVACADCGPGTYAVAGSAQCEPCPSGSFSAASGLVSPLQCSLCPQGTHGVGAGFSSADDACQACPVGTNGRTPGLRSVSECAECTAGLVALATGMTACAPCPDAHYAANSTHCSRCAPDRVINAIGDACDVVCGLGLSPSDSQRACQPCEPGTFAAQAGLVACQVCPAGTFTDAQAQRSCSPCPTGAYSEVTGETKCTACVKSRTTPRDGASSVKACMCDDDRWVAQGVSPLTAQEMPCAQCPIGGVCKAARYPHVAPGYWYDPRDLQTPADVFSVCTPRSACVGGDLIVDNVTATCVAAIREGADRSEHCDDPTATLDSVALDPVQHLCAPSYTGLRCSQCAPRHYRFDTACVPCPEQTVLFILLLLAVIVVALATFRLVNKFRLSIAPLTITVDFFQTLGRQASIDAQWSSPTKAALNLASVFDFDLHLVAPECLVDVTYNQTWMAIMMVPLFGLALLGVYHALRAVRRKRKERVATGDELRRLRRKPPEPHSFVANVLLLCQLLYMVLVLRTLQALDCVTLATGEQVLEASPDIVCWSSPTHRVLVVVSSLAVLIYVVGIPAGFFWTLRQRQTKRGKWLRMTAPLAARFQSSHSRWILVIMARKALLAMGVVLQSTRPGLQLTASAVVMGTGLFLQVKYRPYGPLAADVTKRALSKLADANLMEEVALGASLVVIAGGLAYSAADAAARQGLPLPPAWVTILDVTVIGAICAATAVVLWLSFVVSRELGRVSHDPAVRARFRPEVSHRSAGDGKGRTAVQLMAVGSNEQAPERAATRGETKAQPAREAIAVAEPASSKHVAGDSQASSSAPGVSRGSTRGAGKASSRSKLPRVGVSTSLAGTRLGPVKVSLLEPVMFRAGSAAVQGGAGNAGGATPGSKGRAPKQGEQRTRA